MSFDYQEGKRHAIETIRSVAGMPKCMLDLRETLANLRSTAEQRPKKYRDGVLAVVEMIERLQ